MASPDLRRIQLANGVVLEGGVLCISHIPAQVVAAYVLDPCTIYTNN